VKSPFGEKNDKGGTGGGQDGEKEEGKKRKENGKKKGRREEKTKKKGRTLVDTYLVRETKIPWSLTKTVQNSANLTFLGSCCFSLLLLGLSSPENFALERM
jgi:hypothetical protein